MKMIFEAISSVMPPMGRKMYSIGRPILLKFGLIAVVAGISASAMAKSTVTAVRIGDSAPKTRIVFDLSEKVSFNLFSLADPYRVVINLPEVDWRINVDSVRPGKRVTGFRFGLFRRGQSRVVIDVARPFSVTKKFILEPNKKRGYRLVIDLVDTTRKSFLSAVKRKQLARLPPKKQKPGKKVTYILYKSSTV